jgi:hypothetical protein
MKLIEVIVDASLREKNPHKLTLKSMKATTLQFSFSCSL